MVNQITLDLLKAGQFALAEKFAREALAIKETHVPDEWPTFQTRFYVGWALLGQNQFGAAEPELVAGIDGLLRNEPTATDPLRRVAGEAAVVRVVAAYVAADKPAEAARWRARLPASYWVRDALTRDYSWLVPWGMPVR